jgi:uncharacterized protein (DUF1330 family)
MLLIALSLVPVLCFAACDTPAEEPIDTTAEITTEEPTTEQVTTEEITTEEPTTEEPTTEEITTEAQLQTTVSIEAVKEAALTFVDPEMIKAYAENPDNDWSDFGGMTFNEDGSVKALFTTGKDDKWDPYCYLVKEYYEAGDYAIIQYRSRDTFDVNLYIGSDRNVATGPDEYVHAEIFATPEGEWHYLIVNLADDAMCYDNESGVLGFLRFGLDFAEPGDTVDFGFVAFFYTLEQAAKVLPISPFEE